MNALETNTHQEQQDRIAEWRDGTLTMQATETGPDTQVFTQTDTENDDDGN